MSRWKDVRPPPGTPLRPSALTSGLAAFWPMWEGGGVTIFDMAGRKLIGTLTNGATWGIGYFGRALSLDGVNDYVNLPVPTTFGDQATLACWIKTTQTAAANLYTHSLAAGDFAQLGLHINDTANKFVLFARDTVNNVVASLTSINDGRPHFCVGTRSGSTFSVYVDGVLEATSTLTVATTYDLATNDVIGQYTSGGSNYAGLMDMLLLYTRALLPGDVIQLYADPFCMFESPVRRYFVPAAGPSIAQAGAAVAQQRGALSLGAVYV